MVVLGLAVFRLQGDEYGELQSETRNERLLPTMRDTVRRIWLTYVDYTVAVIAVLWLAGTSPWSALNHTGLQASVAERLRRQHRQLLREQVTEIEESSFLQVSIGSPVLKQMKLGSFCG